MQCCPGERRHDFVTGGHWLAGIAARYDRIAHLASSGSISSSGGVRRASFDVFQVLTRPS